MRAVGGGEEGVDMMYIEHSNMKFSKQFLI